MVIVQKPLLLNLPQKHNQETDRYEQLERFHIFVRSRQNVERDRKKIKNVVMNVKILIDQDMVKSG
jgi:hypothetical protein